LAGVPCSHLFAPVNQLARLKINRRGRRVWPIHRLSDPARDHDHLGLGSSHPVLGIDTFFVEREVLLIDGEGGSVDRFTCFALTPASLPILGGPDGYPVPLPAPPRPELGEPGAREAGGGG